MPAVPLLRNRTIRTNRLLRSNVRNHYDLISHLQPLFHMRRGWNSEKIADFAKIRLGWYAREFRLRKAFARGTGTEIPLLEVPAAKPSGRNLPAGLIGNLYVVYYVCF
ncbi:hypothetical protein Y032_0594g418 [Ancylostoma ceylanicum]|uniref:Uncharacterized protein n=1 Tax=Ancylostoma ceylanicum TaxID=53326 RepID=A0A016WP60_9BILA|nr:hypothetical protein Y032_0594g418 [Ancylostoma ceylanicum]